jgi:hypothetical protein
MQRTRINTIIDSVGQRLVNLFSNPWRKIALSIISLLLGFFMGSAISTTAGQAANWDISVAACLLIFTELISGTVYKNKNKSSSLFLDCLNLFKIGITYSLFVEAFKLGS